MNGWTENLPILQDFVPYRPLPKKDGSGPVMVSSTLSPAVYILGPQNVYSRAEGIAGPSFSQMVVSESSGRALDHLEGFLSQL